MRRFPSPTSHRHLALSPLAVAACSLCLSLGAQAQNTPDDASTLPSVGVTAAAKRQAKASIAGLGDGPAWQQPVQAQTFSEEMLKDAQVTRLADLTKLDASVSDAYNAAGYWDIMSSRGFTLDNTRNYRREGLPINTETSIPLDNKAAIELFKGTSGMQSGISSPGGLINYLVKRPDGRQRTAQVAVTQHGSILTSVDLSERFGTTQQFGARVNAANERLNSAISNTKGHRQLVSLSTDWRLQPGTLVEAEIEYSRRSQHSVVGFSMLADTLPSAGSLNRNLNLNDQPWVQPVVMKGTTGSVRVTQDLAEQWKLVGSYGEQRLKTDDRTAFPFGGMGSDGVTYYYDRYADDGSFDLYDFRSEGEVRVTRAMDVNVKGRLKTAGIEHQVTLGALRTLSRTDVPIAAYNWAGTGSVFGLSAVAPAASLTTAQNDRQERSTELYLTDSLRLSERWRAWGGVRHTQFKRAQTLSDLSQPTSRVSQTLNTPWAALAYQWAPQQQAYVSWGEGVEVLPAKFTVPFFDYTNSGEVLPARKSRQWEIGFKGQSTRMNWSLNWFHVVRPEASSILNADNTYTYQLDGQSTHQGLEGQWMANLGTYTLHASAMVLDAERRGSVKPGINGEAPANVPDYSVKLGASYRVPHVQGLSMLGHVVHEGKRSVDVPNHVRLPAWTRIDVGLAYVQPWQAGAVTWRLGITNLLDTKAWRESPTQFDHIYLLPMAERTITASAQIDF